ncbi:hypothetical protein [Kitasatospora azatica]|uniref:hypothetical protein n=1 Tax=Kitasatospora azatica TaxID=58347 RepID=UPI00056D9718|nr:hypothetical protein [Kitasatospora azatica]
MPANRILMGAAALGVALTLASCGSGASSPSVSVPPSASPAVLNLDEAANHTTVHTRVGTSVVVTLHSTYWPEVTSSAPAVLAPVTVSHPAPTGSGSHGACPVGGGCGSVVSSFQARAAGTAQLTTTRTTCGEAMVCAPDQRDYLVTVEVSG